ncbi:MAG: NosD domain-containing protein [Candidatus Bathyarchaeia archaeon]
MPKDKKTRKSLKESIRQRQARIQKALEAHRLRMEKTMKHRKIPWGKITLSLCIVAIIVLAIYAATLHSPAPSTEEPQTPINQQPSSSPNTIYIWPDGHVEPSNAPLVKTGENYYMLTSDTSLPIIVLKDNIIIDGTNNSVKGSGIQGSRGLDLTGRRGVIITNLKVHGFERGVHIASASNITILGNELTDNYCGIWVELSSLCSITSNKIVKNEGYGVWLKNSTGNIISKNIITSHGNYTVYMGYSSGNRIQYNNFTKNRICMFLYSSSNNTISGNVMDDNYQAIHLLYSVGNAIFLNEIKGNQIGVSFSSSSNNTIYHNNFIYNSIHAEVENSTNIWDDDFPSGGNYWSDYTDKYPDAEKMVGPELWDTPYTIDENNIDRYPRTNPVKSR